MGTLNILRGRKEICVHIYQWGLECTTSERLKTRYVWKQGKCQHYVTDRSLAWSVYGMQCMWDAIAAHCGIIIIIIMGIIRTGTPSSFLLLSSMFLCPPLAVNLCSVSVVKFLLMVWCSLVGVRSCMIIWIHVSFSPPCSIWPFSLLIKKIF